MGFLDALKDMFTLDSFYAPEPAPGRGMNEINAVDSATQPVAVVASEKRNSRETKTVREWDLEDKRKALREINTFLGLSHLNFSSRLVQRQSTVRDDLQRSDLGRVINYGNGYVPVADRKTEPSLPAFRGGSPYPFDSGSPTVVSPVVIASRYPSEAPTLTGSDTGITRPEHPAAQRSNVLHGRARAVNHPFG